MTITSSAVRRYYEQNSKLMLRFGSSPQMQTIHRALWLNESSTLEEALRYSHQLIGEAIERVATQLVQQAMHSKLLVADLGCGVGASMRDLLQQLTHPTLMLGLTISPTQARLAQANLQAKLGQHHCAVIEGDFLAVPMRAGFDVVYSIEAFSHAPSAESYLMQAARLLKPGGRLILIDDFLNQAQDANHEWVRAYQAGWFVPNVQTVEAIAGLAEALGLDLCEQRDLTPLLRLRALPDALALSLLRVGQRLPIRHTVLPSTLGSMALQQCLRDGLTKYRWLMFERRAVEKCVNPLRY